MAKERKKRKAAAKQPTKRQIAASVCKQRFLELYAQVGKASVALRTLGFTRSALDKWRREDEQFREDYDAAFEEATDRLEEEARRRAAEGVTRGIYYLGKKVGEVNEYSDSLLMFLLRARRPDVYRENSRVEHAGEVTSKVTIDFSKRLPNPDQVRERILAAAALLQPSVPPPAPSNGHVNGNSNGNGHHKNGNGHSNGHH